MALCWPRSLLPTILCWGGIGDTLRNLSLVPQEMVYRVTGSRVPVVHRHWRDCDCLESASPPEPAFFKRLIDRVATLEWRGESGEHRGLGPIANRTLRELSCLQHGGTPPYYPVQFQLTEAERAALPTLHSELVIGVQTHLTGMRTKQWGMDNWRVFLAGLVQAYPSAQIILFDTAPEVEELRLSPAILTTRALDIAQSIVLCEKLNLLILIDSWSKYVAAWWKIPQIIIVPDQREEYPSLTTERLLKTEFAGIAGRPNNLLLGLPEPHFDSDFAMEPIRNLAPQTVLRATAALTARVQPA